MMVDDQSMITSLLGVRGHRMHVLGDEPRCPTSNMHGESEFIAKAICSYDLSNHITMDGGTAENRPQTSLPHSTVLLPSP